MFNINCATARHLQELADIPKELAKKIVKYRKKRMRIRHIDELWRIRGMSRKYFANLVKMFYVPNQMVPKIGEQLPYINTMSTLTVAPKSDNKRSRSKKRKPKIKKKSSAGKKRNLSTDRNKQDQPISKKSCINSTKQSRLKEYENIAKNIGSKGKSRKPRKNKSKRNQKQVSISDDSNFGVPKMIDFPTKCNLEMSHLANMKDFPTTNGIGVSNMMDFPTTSGIGQSNMMGFPTTSGIGESNMIDFPTTSKSHGAGRIAKWISSIPKFNLGQKGDKKHVQISNDDKYYSYYIKESEKQESSIGTVKKSSQIFFQKKIPESEPATNLYKRCTIL